MKNIVKLFWMTALALLLAISCASAASDNPNDLAPKPPIPGGYISGHFLEQRTHIHQGIDVAIDDADVLAPVDGTVYHGSGNGFGDGWVYFVSDDGAYPEKLYMLVGDLDSWTGSQPPGPTKVKKGDKIGHVLGWDENVANGAHAHIQFYNCNPIEVYGQTNQTSGFTPFPPSPPNDLPWLVDPGPILTGLGVDLTGTKDYSGPNSGQKYGTDGGKNTYLTVATMEYLGSFLNKIVKEWTDVAANSIVNITPYALSLLSLLCIIDLALPMLLGGFSSFNPNQLIVKAIRYAATFGLIIYWPEFINNILLSIIETFGSAFSSDIESITAGVTQPQLLMQKAMFVITPAFQKISSYGTMDYINNFGDIFQIYCWTFALMFVFIITSAYIALCWVEFYISAGLSVAVVPFASWSMSRFIPEGMGGHLVSSAIKLLIISILVGMVSLAIKDQKPMDIFSTPNVYPNSATTYVDPGTAAGGNETLKANLEKLSAANPYVSKIINESVAAGVDPAIMLSIAAIETGGGDIAAIHMADARDTAGSGLMQIDPGQDFYYPPTGRREWVGDENPDDRPGLFPDYKNDVDQNIRAAIWIYKDKLITADNDPILAAVYYNGYGDKFYLSKFQKIYGELTGKSIATVGKMPITQAMTSKFSDLCIALIICGLMILLIPKRIMRFMGGPLESPQ